MMVNHRQTTKACVMLYKYNFSCYYQHYSWIYERYSCIS